MSTAGSDLQLLFGLLAVVYFFICFFNIGVGLMIMAVAMLFSPEIPIASLPHRALTIRAEDILVMVLAFAWLAQQGVRRETHFFLPSPLNRPILAVIVSSLISTLWGYLNGWVQLITAVFYILKTIEFFGIFFLVMNYVRTENQIRVLLCFSLFTVLLLGFYTLRQVPSVKIFTEHRITAPFEGAPEPATVGGYMAFLLLIIFSLFLYAKRGKLKWFYAVSGVLIFIPFLHTLNRTSYMALGAGLLFIAFIEKRKWINTLLVILFLASPFWLPPSVKDRISFTWTDAKNPGRKLGVDASFQERIVTYQKAWWTWKWSPVIGWGITSFPTPDSQYARTLHETGIVGVALWIWIFTRLFRMSRWVFDQLEGGMLKGMVLGYRAGLVGLILHASASSNFYIVRIMEPFWFISGLVVALYLIRMKEYAENTEEIPVLAAT